MPRLPLLTVALCLLAAAPAGAVVGGSPLDEAQVPWFANLGCGGSLVAPDRVLTAAHCVGDDAPAGLTVAGQVHTVKGVSLAPAGGTPTAAASTSTTSHSCCSPSRSPACRSSRSAASPARR